MTSTKPSRRTAIRPINIPGQYPRTDVSVGDIIILHDKLVRVDNIFKNYVVGTDIDDSDTVFLDEDDLMYCRTLARHFYSHAFLIAALPISSIGHEILQYVARGPIISAELFFCATDQVLMSRPLTGKVAISEVREYIEELRPVWREMSGRIITALPPRPPNRGKHGGRGASV